MRPESFLRGAMILTAAGLFVKLLGALYRIPFTRLVGSEGVGLYQMAYPIYLTLLALSTSGIPVAISLLVAEKCALGDHSGAKQIFRVSLVFLFFLGLILSFGLFQAAPYLAKRVLGDPRAYYPLVSIAPAILVISIVAAFRGYFQGQQMMWPTAVSEVVEQLVRVGTVLWAAVVFLPRGVEFAAAGAAFGTFTGGCGGLLVLCLIFWWFERSLHIRGPRRRQGGRRGNTGLLKRLIVYAFPVSVGSLILPLVQAIDTVIIPNRLRVAGYSIQAATSLFGQLSGMAGTLVFLPAIFTVSLASSLVPHVAAALARGNREEINRRIATAVQMTIIFCLPAAVGLIMLAVPMTTLLFNDPDAGIVTAWLAPAAFFSSLQQTTSGVLLGLGNTWLPMLNMVVGCGVKVVCNYYLTTLPGLGVKGAALGSVFGFTVSFLLNCWSLRIVTRYRGAFLCLPRPFLAVTIMGVALPGIYNFCSPAGNLAATSTAIIVGAAVYFAVLIITGEISIFDLRRFIRR